MFTRTRHGADRLAKQLGRSGVTAEPIHGGRSQGQRDRALAAFKKGHASALIATDVAARGIHVNGVNAVVHYDPPAEDATYLHRSGRTARAGAMGTVVSLIDQSQKKDALKMQRGIGINEPLTSARVNDLVIHAAPVVAKQARTDELDVEHRQDRIVRDATRGARVGAAGRHQPSDSDRQRSRREGHGQVLQLGPRLRLHHPRRRRQGPVRSLLGHRQRRLQDARQRRPRRLTRSARAATVTKRSTSASSRSADHRRSR